MHARLSRHRQADARYRWSVFTDMETFRQTRAASGLPVLSGRHDSAEFRGSITRAASVP
jgi:hypothetical protein